MTDKLFHDSAAMTVNFILPIGIKQHSHVDTIGALYLGDPRFKHWRGHNTGWKNNFYFLSHELI